MELKLTKACCILELLNKLKLSDYVKVNKLFSEEA